MDMMFLGLKGMPTDPCRKMSTVLDEEKNGYVARDQLLYAL